jgi:hypothetical protein
MFHYLDVISLLSVIFEIKHEGYEWLKTIPFIFDDTFPSS